MSLRGKLVSQFMRPLGPLGHLAGWIMANRPSNRERNLWTVDLLNLQPDSSVLEFGCGPGLALERCLEVAPKGHIVGIDHSPVMIAHAAKRNWPAIIENRLSLTLGGENSLNLLARNFDRIFAVNAALFSPDLQALITTLSGKLAPGGMLAITHMPRNRNAKAADAERVANRLADCFANAGLQDLSQEKLSLIPVPAVIVRGVVP